MTLKIKPLVCVLLVSLVCIGFALVEQKFFITPTVVSAQSSGLPIASFVWSVPERFGLRGPDSLINYHWDRATQTYDSNFISPKSWTVNFNACRVENGDTIQSYRWEILGETIIRPDCTLSYDKFKFQGTYPIRLTVTARSGQSNSYEEVITVKDLLIASVGDSIAAGQGNPDFPRNKDKHIKAQWIYSRCHRSAKAGPALAARRIEAADPHTSVTFVSYACSGAGIEALTSKQKKGVKELDAQIARIREAVGDRRIDALLISIGGNDVYFSSLVSKAIFNHAGDGPNDSAEKLFRKGLSTLPSSYSELRDAIATLRADPKVFITEYPDLVHDENGKLCGDKKFTGIDRLLNGIKEDEACWASKTVITGLNCAIAAAAEKYDWFYVKGTNGDFLKHGYCADDANRWVNTFADAGAIQGSSKCRETSFRDCLISAGSFHPNEPGQICFANRIVLALQAAGVINIPGIISKTEPCSSDLPTLPVHSCEELLADNACRPRQ